MSPDHVDNPEYQKLVEELAKDCTCTPLGERPCAGLLAGGVCDRLHLEEDHTELGFDDD